jgi:hypothetical protein
MADAMNADLAWPDSAEAALHALPPGHAFTVPDVLFAKIADEDREGWAEKFAGSGPEMRRRGQHRGQRAGSPPSRCPTRRSTR